VAHHVIDSRPDVARQALGAVEKTSRAALVEMRRLLGVLRQGDEPAASLAPTPGLADLPKLLAQFAEAGLDVRADVDDPDAEVPDGVDLSAYRIVQEGLTNVLRHGGPRADVRIAYPRGALTIEICDEGLHRGPAPSPGAGHGLIGMRERVAVFDGTFAAGPKPGGGFQLSVSLPFGHGAAGQPAAAGRPTGDTGASGGQTE
jgi:signal transduction histidine kinase